MLQKEVLDWVLVQMWFLLLCIPPTSQELEFQISPQTAIEALIHINNQLRQPEAAVGVLTYAQKHLHMELKESWCAEGKGKSARGLPTLLNC